jgi:hypothetical protein
MKGELMTGRFIVAGRARFVCGLALCFLCAGLATPAPSPAQSAQGDPADISFQVVNATTGQAGTVDRLTIEYLTHVPNPVIDIQPEGPEFTVPEVPIKDIGKYVITAWKSGVPYFWSKRGQALLTETTTLHVFDTSEDRSALVIAGLDFILKKTESLVQLEYMLRVENAARPQVTIVGDPVLELYVPEGARDFDASYNRGSEPTPVTVRQLGSNRVGLVMPLTTGNNQIRLVCRAPWQEGMTIPLGSDLGVQAWNLLASPVNLDIQAFELEPSNDRALPGHLRFRGPSLDAGRRFTMRLQGSIPAGPEEEVFTTEAPAEQESEPSAEEENGPLPFPVFVATPIIVVFIVLLVVRRRRS